MAGNTPEEENGANKKMKRKPAAAAEMRTGNAGRRQSAGRRIKKGAEAEDIGSRGKNHGCAEAGPHAGQNTTKASGKQQKS
jgi:hypothetical protein